MRLHDAVHHIIINIVTHRRDRLTSREIVVKTKRLLLRVTTLSSSLFLFCTLFPSIVTGVVLFKRHRLVTFQVVLLHQTVCFSSQVSQGSDGLYVNDWSVEMAECMSSL